MTVLAACSDVGSESPELDTTGYRDGGKFIALNDNNTLVLFDGGRSYYRGSSPLNTETAPRASALPSTSDTSGPSSLSARILI